MMRIATKRLASNSLSSGIIRRNIGVAAYALQKAAPGASARMDPIQKLFLDKVRDYKTKSKKVGEGKLVDVSPQFEQKMHKEIDGMKRRFGSGNMEEFPKFDFLQK
eukprot:Seg5642.2 transcript_id=Seg5642.2/GoldUCD/mRNA.D3Y31 product="ATP synthase-coupling factor 6 mitochondrial" protein_id=Seg5642.2/GoldUCD/D3Y31